MSENQNSFFVILQAIEKQNTLLEKLIFNQSPVNYLTTISTNRAYTWRVKNLIGSPKRYIKIRKFHLRKSTKNCISAVLNCRSKSEMKAKNKATMKEINQSKSPLHLGELQGEVTHEIQEKIFFE
jgi:hypothetical protein